MSAQLLIDSVNTRLFLLLVCAVVGLLAAPAASAGRIDAVDPGLMQPPLNPSFAPWECWRAGERTICEGSKTDTYAGLEVDFLSCATGPVYSDGVFTSTARRVADAEGRAIKTSFRDRYEEYFSSEPSGVEPKLRSIGRLQHTFSYGVPGDPSTVSETLAGMVISVTGTGVGLVMHDVGTLAWDSEGAVIRNGGVHPLAYGSDDWDAIHDRICSVFD